MSGISLTMGGATVTDLKSLLDLMRAHLDRFDAGRDHRAAFLRVYYLMTSGVTPKMASGFFMDDAWIERVAIHFAWWYFNALDRHERSDSPPPAWGYAFDIAQKRKGFLLQDVLLGMNAHINNDLPLVVEAILRAEGDAATPARLMRRRFDHDQINRLLQEVIPHVENEIACHYGRLIRPLGQFLGTLDQSLATYGLKTFRDNVWRNAQFLLAARDEGERRRVIGFIEQDAMQVALEVERFPLLRWCRPLAPVMRRWRLC